MTDRIQLKEGLKQITDRLKRTSQQLESKQTRLEERYKELFNQRTKVQKNDSASLALAALNSNNRIEAKNNARVILSSRCAIDKILWRLDTVSHLEYLAAEMRTAAEIIRTVSENLQGIALAASQELSNISQCLYKMAKEAGEDADNILAEASAIAEKKIGEDFPDL